MSAYISKCTCCGSNKDKTACCDCPIEIDDRNGDINLACGDSFTIFGGNFEGLVSGTIRVLEQSNCGLCVTITSDCEDHVFKIPRPNQPISDNVLSFAFTNVTDITVTCLSDTGGDCFGNYSYKLIDRCISTSLPKQ
ncbi:S-Ena type endospore appendage [Bacillus solimangrovi]|uniref:DUF3992 domain-containing protein n=1 Tax=Bacillus solimangrovi TaxID=1305675 RepID=A0A1E5LJ15_9BACI|nr:S-Ena type endospore appendage [Bacillus solimangrovi]OEH94082.1 hypothetical protein BFG57_09555 [Bacillus solimangrovi]